MGRIRTIFIKKVSKELFSKVKDDPDNKFSTDFEKNKKVITKLADIPSKKLRNRVVGYVTSLAKKRKYKEV